MVGSDGWAQPAMVATEARLQRPSWPLPHGGYGKGEYSQRQENSHEFHSSDSS